MPTEEPVGLYAYLLEHNSDCPVTEPSFISWIQLREGRQYKLIQDAEYQIQIDG